MHARGSCPGQIRRWDDIRLFPFSLRHALRRAVPVLEHLARFDRQFPREKQFSGVGQQAEFKKQFLPFRKRGQIATPDLQDLALFENTHLAVQYAPILGAEPHGFQQIRKILREPLLRPVDSRQVQILRRIQERNRWKNAVLARDAGLRPDGQAGLPVQAAGPDERPRYGYPRGNP
jgi:hypothetical protein